MWRSGQGVPLGSTSSTPHAQTWPQDVEITPKEALDKDSLQFDLTSLLLQRGAFGCITPGVLDDSAFSGGRTDKRD